MDAPAVTKKLNTWLDEIIADGGDIRAFVMRFTCTNRKCGEAGWGIFLLGPYGIILSDTEKIFAYPGIRRQLNEYLLSRPGISSEFARVKRRTAPNRGGTSFFLQGCSFCDSPWPDSILANWAKSYFGAYGGALEDELNDIQLKHAFTVDIERLLES